MPFMRRCVSVWYNILSHNIIQYHIICTMSYNIIPAYLQDITGSGMGVIASCIEAQIRQDTSSKMFILGNDIGEDYLIVSKSSLASLVKVEGRGTCVIVGLSLCI